MPRTLWALCATLVLAPFSSAQVAPAKALASFTPAPGMQVELFASEPMLTNPTSIDVDSKGRVWVAEAVNYRRVNFNRPILREAGDRIVILTDTNGDGKADKSDVFYQGKELYGPLSVMVLPLPGAKNPDAVRVLVAQSPDILEFVDANGDGKADGPPTKFLTGFGGFDHDHGVHGLTTGPDGKIYFTVGDQGVKGLQSKDGSGREYTTSHNPNSDIQAGTVWRVDTDGNNLELIAHNFRNNYEATVDSFGEIWLSDNDDDGNQQTRICFVMPGGNYGYWPRGAGESHWHEEKPGIVHKTLRTGFGSPTGICFYEGNLFPQLTNQLVHADAGPREIRAFKRIPKGAGYELEKTLLLTSTDNWFRPSDVCVAPDGSIFVADWYDPGVGGHGMGDHTRGRIYRLTPKGHAGYKVPAVKLDTYEGVLAALGSPAASVRAQAHERLSGMGMRREEFWAVIDPAWDAATDNTLRARLINSWFVCKDCTGMGKSIRLNQAYYADMEKTKPAEDHRLTAAAVRAMSAFGFDRRTPGDGTRSVSDVKWGVDVERELLLDMRHIHPAVMSEDFYRFAKLYDGHDIFYRAALNIALGTDPKRRDAILADFPKQFPEWNDKVADLVWELRPKSMLPRLGELMADPKLSAAQKARIVEILAASPDVAAGQEMVKLLTGDHPAEVKARAARQLELFLPTKWKALAQSPEFAAAVETLLSGVDRVAGAKLVAAAKRTQSLDAVAKLAADSALPIDARLAAVKTLGIIKGERSVAALQKLLADEIIAAAAVNALADQVVGKVDSPGAKSALKSLEGLMTGPNPKLKVAALSALAGSRAGTGYLLALKQKGQFPAGLEIDAGRLLRTSPFQGERNKAMMLFPAPGKLDPKSLPASGVLAQRLGDAANGKRLFLASATSELQCLKCHTVAGGGGKIGPDLSLIGKKGSKENLYDSVLYPSKAIADQYITWAVETDDGQLVSGLLIGETEAELTLRDSNGKDFVLPIKSIERRKKSLVSLMPEGLVNTLTEPELADLVAYLATLQTASLTPISWELRGPFPAPDDSALDRLPTGGTARAVRTGSNGYVDLAAFHGDKSLHSMSMMTKTIIAPSDQDVTLLVGTDDACRLIVNGVDVLRHTRHDAATPGRDRVPVRLKKGENVIRLAITNGNDPHGFYFTIEGGSELTAK